MTLLNMDVVMKNSFHHGWLRFLSAAFKPKQFSPSDRGA
jgi:hypothetical protein